MIIKNSQWKSSWQHPNEWLYQIEFESFLLFIHSFIHFSYRRIFKQISFIADKKAFGETFFFSLSVLSTINRLSEEYMLERERAREWEKITDISDTPEHPTRSTHFQTNGIQWYSFILTFAAPLSCGQMLLWPSLSSGNIYFFRACVCVCV